MSTSIYVGNLPFSTNADEIRDLFSAYGTVESVNLITDRETGQLRGFGFVAMTSEAREPLPPSIRKSLGAEPHCEPRETSRRALPTPLVTAV